MQIIQFLDKGSNCYLVPPTHNYKRNLATMAKNDYSGYNHNELVEIYTTTLANYGKI